MGKAKAAPTTPSAQRTLESFFSKTTTPKRKGDDENIAGSSQSESEAVTPKRTKTEEVATASGSPSSGALTPDQKKLIMQKQSMARLKLLSHNLGLIDPSSIGASWFTNILEQEFKKPYFKQLSDFYVGASSRSTVYPPREQIFSWTRHCELRDVKVVILGQDPYHGPRQAHGLCFSVQKGVPAPLSLANMYKELKNDPGVEEFTEIPSHGYLVGWAEQGVLLLNAVLTVEASKPNSHKDKGWETLTTAVIRWISNNLKDVVFLLWGSYAQKMGNSVDKKRHVVLNCAHPSPLSAHRGFFGCGHFSKCNEELEKRGKAKIQWEKLP